MCVCVYDATYNRNLTCVSGILESKVKYSKCIFVMFVSVLNTLIHACIHTHTYTLMYIYIYMSYIILYFNNSIKVIHNSSEINRRHAYTTGLRTI